MTRRKTAPRKKWKRLREAGRYAFALLGGGVFAYLAWETPPAMAPGSERRGDAAVTPDAGAPAIDESANAAIDAPARRLEAAQKASMQTNEPAAIGKAPAPEPVRIRLLERPAEPAPDAVPIAHDTEDDTTGLNLSRGPP